MRLVFAGTPAAALPSLEALLASSHDVVGVLTRPDAPAGRGRRLVPSPIAQRAAEAGLPTVKASRLRDPETLEAIRQLGPDACAIVAYGALVPPAALTIPPLGWVNLHFSVLPAWRGAAPVQHAVLAGDEVTGATTFLLEEGLDTGPVLGVLTETVRPRDTSGELLTRLSEAGAGLLVATMDGLESGGLRPVPQPDEGISLAPKIGVEQARVPWASPGFHVDRLARAMTPEPGPWTTFRGERLGLGPVLPQSSQEGPTLAPGELRADKRQVLVGTGTEPVALTEVRPPGKRPMAAADWARGVRPLAGERLD
ncbi:MAG: methionyl-tRNA formyltransferase [Actinomycetales bacterium]